MKRWVVRIAAVLLVGLTVIGLIGHAVNIARHSTPDKLGSGSCTAQWINKPSAAKTITYADVVNGKTFSMPVAVTCNGVDVSKFSVSYHVYNGAKKLLNFNNPRYPLDGKQAVVRLTAGELAAFQSDNLRIQSDLVKGAGFWVSQNFTMHSRPLEFHVDVKGISAGLAHLLNASSGSEDACSIRVSGERDFRYGSGQLATQPILPVKVKTNCASLAGKRITYHVVSGNGRLMAWNVNRGQRIPAKWPIKHSPSPKTSLFTQSADSASTWVATLPIDVYRYREAAPGTLHFVLDVVDGDGPRVLQNRVSAPVINVDYAIPRLRHRYQLIPPLVPASSVVKFPVVYDLYAGRPMNTPFKLATAFLRTVGSTSTRSDGIRRVLPPLRAGDNWHLTWSTMKTPSQGVYSVKVGFVNDPYTWYGFMFKTGTAKAVALNPFWFIVCCLVGIGFLVEFCKRIVATPHWYGKLLYSCAAALVFYICVVPLILSTVGVALIVAIAYLYVLLEADSENYKHCLLIAGFCFGLSMELFWGMGRFVAPWYAIVLSTVLQGVVVFLLLIPWRKATARTIIVLLWFAVWLVVYLTFDLYARYFGVVPTVDVFTYANQGLELTGEVAQLFRPTDWAGLAIWCIFPASVLLGWRRMRAVKHMGEKNVFSPSSNVS